jgi:phage/plasmid-associated DNA primase
VVLLGSKGIGKSKFIKLASESVGRDYVCCMNNIHELKNHFNNFFHECVLVSVEEVGDGTCKDEATQNTLKALITESHMKVERQHVDSFQAQNNCSFVICSNFHNTVKITQDNKRFVVLALN